MSVGEGSSERDWNQTELRERSKHCTSPPEPQTKARDPAGCHRTRTIADCREKRNAIQSTCIKLITINSTCTSNLSLLYVTDYNYRCVRKCTCMKIERSV